AISSFVTLTLPSGTSPFGVVSPPAGAVLHHGPNTVTWTVGGTNAAPISCTSVSIRLSTDDGATFGTVLGTFPNNGTATVNLPDTAARARLRIDGVGKIFFAMSPSYMLQAACPPDFNHDNVVNSQDFFDFITAFFAGTPNADFNVDGVV